MTFLTFLKTDVYTYAKNLINNKKELHCLVSIGHILDDSVYFDGYRIYKINVGYVSNGLQKKIASETKTPLL